MELRGYASKGAREDAVEKKRTSKGGDRNDTD